MRTPPDRVERLPQQYFTALLAEVSRHAALEADGRTAAAEETRVRAAAVLDPLGCVHPF